jgi:capsid portal protein
MANQKKNKSHGGGGSSTVKEISPAAKELLVSLDIVRALQEVDAAQKGERFADPNNKTGQGEGTGPYAVDKLPFDSSRNPVRRQSTEEDEAMFKAHYAAGLLIEPYWYPATLYRIFEESDILQSCIRAMVDNINRPFVFDYVGPKDKANDADVQARKQKLVDFFSQVNGKHSYVTLSKKEGLDFWVGGNCFTEVIEDPETLEPEMMYSCPGSYVRASELDPAPYPVFVPLPRNGGIKNILEWRWFRRFCRVQPGEKDIWFKELGDPRMVNRDTGDYFLDDQGRFLLEADVPPGQRPKNRATSLWWRRDTYGGNAYGIPRYVSGMAEIRGRYLASWVNYDTLDHGGLPPWLLLIYGRLGEGTRKYLMDLVKSWRDPGVFSEPGFVEIEPNMLSFNSTGGAKAGAEFVSLRDMRSEDAMFSNYRKETGQSVGSMFRIPAILYGVTEGAGGTNYAALEMAENQVFGPLRAAWDERTNVELIQARFKIFDWKIRTKQAPIGDKEQLYKALGMAGRTGGPSLNDLTAMENEVFGTQWPEREHWFYSKISAAEAIAMVRNGQVTYDQKTGEPIILPPATQPTGGEMKAAGDSSHEELMAEADAINVLHAFRRIEQGLTAWKHKGQHDHEIEM